MHNYIQLVTKPALFSQDCQTIVYSFNIHFFGPCHIQRRLASGSIDLRATAIKLVFSDLYKACSFRNPSVYTRY